MKSLLLVVLVVVAFGCNMFTWSIHAPSIGKVFAVAAVVLGVIAFIAYQRNIRG